MPRLFQRPFSCQPTSVCACEASVDPTGGERLRGREPRTESTMRESRAEQLTVHQSTLRTSGELSCVGRTLHYNTHHYMSIRQWGSCIQWGRCLPIC